jgi:hypothetical protein
VDNHDEAMRWASNKIFEWNQNTQAYQVYEYQESEPIKEDTVEREKRKDTVRIMVMMIY